MTVKVRFRPVLLGPPDRPAAVFYMAEDPQGHVYFQDLEIAWPLNASLDTATVEDLPAFYRGRDFGVALLAVQEVAGKTLYEAGKRMDEVLEELYAADTRRARERQTSSTRQRASASSDR